MSQQQDQQRLLLERFQREVSRVVIGAGMNCVASVAKHTAMCRQLRGLEAATCSVQQACKVHVCCGTPG
jgi:hypothetical protein